ncbi:ribose-phosphate diphosphokinase [Chromobacterium sp. IIBBL 290-4]|uniref:ribose-phosphate diphosphokinase n=1 Tax=Chromobacterium sp. IIBBL 290-4 TaxID=2953890 RepID=UPI0020B8E14A|nr:ribose-phosphate diphosphokinase [Chromobacterium sp. IIBBL 290-4]UTH74441.1 ribose-phosphate diphosphokinase [Chromobacterium sp. IIBBL 290-4]
MKIFKIANGSHRLPVSLQSLVFPGGEVHVTVETDVPGEALLIDAHLPDSATIMTLLLVTDALRHAYPGTPITLRLPYVPYARQDRVANPGEALSAKVFCQLINSQQYQRVVIQDPHSDVVSALLDRVEIEDPLPALREVIRQTGPVALVAPDAGARKRVLKLAKSLALDVVFADKIRDTHTGAITGTQIASPLPDLPLLVVDDICDGGRTFTELAAALATQQQTQSQDHPLYLFVTHGIFSKGLEPLLSCYHGVFTRNNWTQDDRCQLV